MDTRKLDPNYIPTPTTVAAGEAVGTVACGAKNGVIRITRPVASRVARVFTNFGRGVKRGWQKSA